MFDIRPLVGRLRATLPIALTVTLTIVAITYAAARVSALDKAHVEKVRLASGGLSLRSDAVLPLQRAHAHNDYAHRRPLFDALARGFSSIEADVWLSRGKLLVAHYFWETAPSRTLTSLYLEPLRRRIEANQGAVYRGSRESVQLLIDVKTDSEDTYRSLHKQLARYADMLTTFEGGGVRTGPVTAIISGNCPRALMAKQSKRFAGCDGRIEDLGRASSASMLPLISEDWGSVFDWRGDGAMPSAERSKLLQFTRTAHARGQKVRFWSTPDASGSKAQAAVWRELVAAGVDYINTDALDTLRGFLLRYDRPSVRSVIASPWLGAPPTASARLEDLASCDVRSDRACVRRPGEITAHDERGALLQAETAAEP
jgi:hypothetical protein